MKINELNQRVTFVRKEPLPPDYSGFPRWEKTDLFTTWEKVENGGFSETETNNATFDSSTLKVTIRFRPPDDNDGTMLITHKGVEYEIIGVDTLGFGREFLAITVKRLEVQE